MGEPGVDVGLDVPTGSPGQFVAHGFVPLAGLGLPQRAELAQRLELVGAGGDPLRLADGGLAFGGGRGIGSELGLDDVVDIRVVDGARRGGGEQLSEALPLRELRPAADVIGQVLVPRVCRASNRASSRAAAMAPASMPFARRRTTRWPMRAGATGSRGAVTRGTSGRRALRWGVQGVVIVGLVFVVRISERAAARALYDGPSD
ncbi:hypothetical protein [Streptomyces sp. NTH33]|uniref:hypothetical protein n=1 Tax=Streptomyces sp. NTH33 TaxID=1735453 RepID=UPI0021ABF340|nr:hypothetical protein [Streptomyces sp. NTH33]